MAVEGLSLPVELGGDYEWWSDSSAWVRVPGTTRPILRGRTLSEIDLDCAFMARIEGGVNDTARFRIWDLTRAIRLGDEREIRGPTEVYYQLHGIQLAPQDVQVEAQVRVLTAAAVNCYGVRLAAGV